jgi:hypothetical protein
VSELAPAQPGRRDRLRSLYSKLLPSAFLAASSVNVALSFLLPPSAQPLRLHADSSLTHLVHVEQPSVDRRFAFYLELDDATDGGVLIVPVGSFVDSDLAEGLADFEVVERDYDPTLIPGDIDRPPSLGTVDTEDGDLPYSIVAGDDDVWWVAIVGDWIMVMPESVALAHGVGP